MGEGGCNTMSQMYGNVSRRLSVFCGTEGTSIIISSFVNGSCFWKFCNFLLFEI